MLWFIALVTVETIACTITVDYSVYDIKIVILKKESTMKKIINNVIELNYSDWIKHLKLEWDLNALQRVKQKSCESFRMSYKAVLFNVLYWWNLSWWFQWTSPIYLIFIEVKIPLLFQFHFSWLFLNILNCVSTSHIYYPYSIFFLENGRYVLFYTSLF